MSYMEMIYIDSSDNARKTDVGAVFETPEATKAVFESARQEAVAVEDAEFLLDLHDQDGDLVDTIPINRNGFEKITGEKALNEADYLKIDQDYWDRAKQEGQKSA